MFQKSFLITLYSIIPKEKKYKTPI